MVPFGTDCNHRNVCDDGHLHTEDARDQVDLHHLDDLFLLPVGALAVNHRGWGVGSAGGKLVMRCVMPLPLQGGLTECDIKAGLGNSGEILRSLDSFPENWRSIEDLFRFFRMKNGQCTVDMQYSCNYLNFHLWEILTVVFMFGKVLPCAIDSGLPHGWPHEKQIDSPSVIFFKRYKSEQVEAIIEIIWLQISMGQSLSKDWCGGLKWVWIWGYACAFFWNFVTMWQMCK